MDEKSYKICYSLQFFTAFSSTAAAANSQSCDKTLKGREAEQNPWQSDEGVGQELNILRSDVATRIRGVPGPEVSAFIWHTPGKDEISPRVKKSEDKAKDERLKETFGSPVPSPLSHFPPQGSKAIALIELLKLIL